MPDRILVVDDEEAIREIVCAILAAAGYTWKQASSGMEALALLNSGEEFELMLSDLMMADLDGIGLLERTKEKFPDMPVVMVTAVHDISVALAAIRNGAYDYLLKPFEREQLLNAVGRALENRRLKVENRTYQTNLESLVEARTDQLQAAMADLERSYDITLQALGDALDLKDAETEGHSRRVTAFTIAIARAMGVPREQILVIARGAFLHDIGKMAIPDNILRKPGKLDDDERAIMREHCYHGYQMLKKIPFLAEACDIVYSHQEHFDGTGYPRGLKRQRNPARRAHLLRRRYSRRHHLRPPLSSRQNSHRSSQRNPGLDRPPVRSRGRRGFPEDARRHLRRPPPRNQRPELSLQLLRQRQRLLTQQKSDRVPIAREGHDVQSRRSRLAMCGFSR